MAIRQVHPASKTEGSGRPATNKATVPAELVALKAHYKGPPSFTDWCQQFTREVVTKTSGTLGPFLRTILVSKFHLSEQAAEALEAAVVRAVEADAVATDETLASKLLNVFGKIIPQAGKVVGWGGVGLSAALALYEFKRGDGFAGISNAGAAVFGAQTMLEVLPALPEVGAVAGTIASVAPAVLFAAEVAAVKMIYEQSLISLNKGFRAQSYATRLPAPYGKPGEERTSVDPAEIRQAIFEALPERTGPDAAQATYAQSKAFNDFMDQDFMGGGQGFFGGAGHRDFTDYLNNVVVRWGAEWKEVVTRFYGRRSHFLDAANEAWIAKQMQTIVLRFLEQEIHP
jgi:hypothetical protein